MLGLFKIDGSRIIVNDSGEQRSEELIAYISNYARVHGLSINGKTLDVILEELGEV